MKLKRTMRWTGGILLLAFLALFVAYWMSDNSCGSGKASALLQPMKAVVYCDYGRSDVLKLEDVEKPVPADDELLVQVRAAAINPLDWHYMRGTPYLLRIGAGLRRPKDTRMGVDFAGIVEAVGKNVTQFKPGDEVFGARSGAFAEFVAVPESRAVAQKPSRLTFEQAAAVPIAAITALQALRDKANLEAGQKILINGASGGVGTFAVQIAKSMGADVTGVCSERNSDLVRSLGAGHIIDYKKVDYTQGDEKYDVIIDNVGNHGLLENRRVLNPDGKFVLIGGGGPDEGNWIGAMAKPINALLLSPFISQDMGMMLAQMNHADLAYLGELMQSGNVTPVIDRTYRLDQAAEAIDYLEAGHARGKVIITVEKTD